MVLFYCCGAVIVGGIVCVDVCVGVSLNVCIGVVGNNIVGEMVVVSEALSIIL